MSVSAARTIVLPAVPTGGTPQWPMAVDPDSLLDYSVDFSALLADVGGDTISSASVSARPSGTGELQPENLLVAGAIVTADLTAGVYGRYYWVKVEATSAAGRVFVALVQLKINPAMMIGSPATPPSTGFGTPLILSSGVLTSGTAFGGVATGLTGAGTSQATATPLAAAQNVATGGAAGGGFVLNGSILSGTIRLTNDWSGDQLLYPPVGAQLDTAAVNAPVSVAPGDTVAYATTSPGSQWYRT